MTTTASSDHQWDAEEYDAGNSGQFQTAIEALMEAGSQLHVGGRFADVGCGSGRLAEAMASRDFSVVASDVSQSMVEATRRRCRGLAVEATVQDAHDLRLPAASFEIVHSSWMLHWLSDPDQALRAMARAVVPGGVLVAQWSCGQARADGFALRDTIQAVFDRPRWASRLEAAPLEMFHHPLDEVRAVLESEGLVVELTEEDLAVPGGEDPVTMRRSLRSAAFATQAAVLGDDVDDLIDESLVALMEAGALRVANTRIIASRPGQPRSQNEKAGTSSTVRRFPLAVGELEVVATTALTPRFQRLELHLLGGERLPVEEPAETLTMIWPAHGGELVLPERGRWRFPPGTPLQPTANYTVRDHDPATGRFTIDVFLHDGGGRGVAWARTAEVGDRVGFGGSRVHWVSRLADADWTLLLGDETALSSIAAVAETLPDGGRFVAVIEIGDETDREALDISDQARSRLELNWVPRVEGRSALLDAVRQLDVPEGYGAVWGGAELTTIRRLRAHLTGDRNLDRSQLSLQGYWVGSAEA